MPAGGDTVISTRSRDGSVSFTPAGMLLHFDSAETSLDSWLLKASENKEAMLRIDLAKRPKIFKEARCAAIVKIAELESGKYFGLPLVLGLGIYLVKVAIGFLGILGTNESGLIKQAQRKHKTLSLFIRLIESSEGFLEECSLAGFSAKLLPEGREFKGIDETGTYRPFTDLKKDTLEFALPDDVSGVMQDEIHLLDVPIESIETVFMLALAKDMIAEMRKRDIGFEFFLIFEDDACRLIREIDKNELRELGLTAQ